MIRIRKSEMVPAPRFDDQLLQMGYPSAVAAIASRMRQ
jgi:hypothetical protein